ncbi:MAG: prenyltransferase/squalene oxidase repeat-containing protein [Thermogutta sp.]
MKDIQAAWQFTFDMLMNRCDPGGFWRGRLCSSPLATATATSALAVYSVACQSTPDIAAIIDRAIQSGVAYLLSAQRPDGGWGDTERSLSNIATTYLVCAALELSGKKSLTQQAVRMAQTYIDRENGENGLRQRYGQDQTFVAPILTNIALAGRYPWDRVPQLPFELAAFPQSLYRFLRLPVVSYAIPALVAIGLAKFHHGRKSNTTRAWLRRLVEKKCLAVVESMQPESGGFLEAIPLTAFVAMSLSSSGIAQHPIVQKAIRFLLSLQRNDGSWPVDIDLATWVTTLSINALAASGCSTWYETVNADWILNCQHLDVHPFTGAQPGGWGWTDHPGSVPDADDTSGALLSLAHFWNLGTAELRAELLPAVLLGLDWLLNLQNRDGGWPTFCRGWGTLPFDRSAVDLTAHAVRALAIWHRLLTASSPQVAAHHLVWNERWPEVTIRKIRRLRENHCLLLRRIGVAIKRGVRYLGQSQKPDGHWLPLWFGNEFLPNEENPVYGTSRCLMAYVDLEMTDDAAAVRGVNWLMQAQNRDGSWGRSSCGRRETQGGYDGSEGTGSVEETALAIAALSHFGKLPGVSTALERGLKWLLTQIENGGLECATPIGLYFARLWYYEDSYPIIFALEALGRYLKCYQDGI